MKKKPRITVAEARRRAAAARQRRVLRLEVRLYIEKKVMPDVMRRLDGLLADVLRHAADARRIGRLADRLERLDAAINECRRDFAGLTGTVSRLAALAHAHGPNS